MPDGLRHEDYSAELIRHEMKDVIDGHPDNVKNFKITASEIADFYQGKATVSPELLFWKELVAGQLDADRMDYLLRDSLHCGVDYGRFDLSRIVDTLMIVEDTRADSPAGLRIGIEQGGLHAAEGLILARYFMFTQVYFHPVRKAYDHHAIESIGLLLGQHGRSNPTLPDPRTRNGRKRFLAIDDWRVADFIRRGHADRHGKALLRHEHDRCVYRTPEVPKQDDLAQFDAVRKALRRARFDVWTGDAEKEWYSIGKAEIRIGHWTRSTLEVGPATPLSEISDVVARIPESKQRLLFVPADQKTGALTIIDRSRRTA
jgi:HD superfamily phosphohydrolase